MSNHYHVVLHINREQSVSWDVREVLERWTTLFSGHLLVQRFLANDSMNKAEIQRVEEFAEEYRCRLQDISWFMRCLNHCLKNETLPEKRTKRTAAKAGSGKGATRVRHCWMKQHC